MSEKKKIRRPANLIGAGLALSERVVPSLIANRSNRKTTRRPVPDTHHSR